MTTGQSSFGERKYKKNSAERKKFDEKKFLEEYHLENLSLSEVKNLLNKELNKEQLLLIAEKKFGIPRGSNLRRSKKQVVELIRSAINQDESLEIIRQRASE